VSADGAPAPTYVLGGYQTDFARNVTKEGGDVYSLLEEAVQGALEATQVPAADVDVAHVGNLAAELFCGQAQLGGMVAAIDPAFGSLPTSRNVDAQTAAEHLGSAAWAGREATDARFPWPALDGARTAATLNVGGSCTTVVSFIVGR
jgi:acetyl-CoA C-acetyltransferase